MPPGRWMGGVLVQVWRHKAHEFCVLTKLSVKRWYWTQENKKWKPPTPYNYEPDIISYMGACVLFYTNRLVIWYFIREIPPNWAFYVILHQHTYGDILSGKYPLRGHCGHFPLYGIFYQENTPYRGVCVSHFVQTDFLGISKRVCAFITKRPAP